MAIPPLVTGLSRLQLICCQMTTYGSCTPAFNPAIPVTSQPSVSSIQSPSFPTDSTPSSYLVAFRADLDTLEGIELYETRIYQPDLTPGEIRQKLKLALRTVSPFQPMPNFQPKDIPPCNLAPRTHSVLHALFADRDRPNRDTADRNVTNRAMFHVYSESPFLIHKTIFSHVSEGS
jgi:hypothetical protein